MITVFKIHGMTCQGCADKIEGTFISNAKITSAKVSLDKNELTIDSFENFDSHQIESILSSIGNYGLIQDKSNAESKIIKYLRSNKPILLALLIVTILSLSLQVSYKTFDLNNWFLTYMGIFFVLFSFLKLFDVKTFSVTFTKYDILAKRIPKFSITYPFLEFLLGIAFLTQTILIFASIITLIVMTSQTIGVMRVLRKHQTIQCACLGSSISLPISHITFLENMVMILMSLYMIYQYIY